MGRLHPATLRRLRLAPGDLLIETGTQLGHSTRRCAPFFNTVKTIEADAVSYFQARKRLHSHANVRLHFGDSGKLLSSLIEPTRRTTFFLDSHWQPDLPPAHEQCPLRAELAAIFGATWSAPFDILIDDACLTQPFMRWRRMEKKGYKLEQWPDEDEIRRLCVVRGCEFQCVGDMIWIKGNPNGLESTAGRHVEKMAESQP